MLHLEIFRDINTHMANAKKKDFFFFKFSLLIIFFQAPAFLYFSFIRWYKKKIYLQPEQLHGWKPAWLQVKGRGLLYVPHLIIVIIHHRVRVLSLLTMLNTLHCFYSNRHQYITNCNFIYLDLRNQSGLHRYQTNLLQLLLIYLPSSSITWPETLLDHSEILKHYSRLVYTDVWKFPTFLQSPTLRIFVYPCCKWLRSRKTNTSLRCKINATFYKH